MRLQQLGLRPAEEFLQTIDLAAASTEYRLTNGIPNTYWMYGLRLLVRLRNVVGTATVASLPFGSPFTFIERVTVRGQAHRGGTKTIIDLTGRQIAQLARFSKRCMGMVKPDNFVVGAGAVATYDVEFLLDIPFHLLTDNASAIESTLLPGNAFTNNLELIIKRGGLESMAVNSTSTQTFTAFGSGSGNPSVTVSRIIDRRGPNAAGQLPILCRKTTKGPFSLASSGSNARIGDLPVGNVLTKLHMQVGIQETDSGQNGELASGNNDNVSRVQLKHASEVIRDFNFRSAHYGTYLDNGIDMGADELTSQGPTGQTGGFNKSERVGEVLVNFCPDSVMKNGLDTRDGREWPGGSFAIWGDWTGATNQVMEVITEEIERL